MALAWPRNWPYLNRMIQPISTQHGLTAATPAQGSSGGVATAIVWSAAGLGALAVCAAAALWFHYGTTVFFEMIAAGISACF